MKGIQDVCKTIWSENAGELNSDDPNGDWRNRTSKKLDHIVYRISFNQLDLLDQMDLDCFDK